MIAAIQTRRSVSKLVLGHNDLRDDGCVILFRYLSSARGRKLCTSEISLNSNAIGDVGLSAIADYLEGNEHLTDLFLQNVSSLFVLVALCILFLSLSSERFQGPYTAESY